MERILAVDYGRRRIGLAIGDAMGFGARGLDTLHATNLGDAVEAVSEVVRLHEAGRVVVGLPLNMDGSHGEMARAAEAFADMLRDATRRPVSLMDERLTSAQAQRSLRVRGTKIRGRKGLIDKIAATLLLETYQQQMAMHSGEDA